MDENEPSAPHKGLLSFAAESTGCSRESNLGPSVWKASALPIALLEHNSYNRTTVNFFPRSEVHGVTDGCGRSWLNLVLKITGKNTVLGLRDIVKSSESNIRVS